MEFEWDENKRRANLRKHGLDLIDGRALFDGRPIYTYPSPRFEEQRGTVQFIENGMNEKPDQLPEFPVGRVAEGALRGQCAGLAPVSRATPGSAPIKSH